MQSLLPLLSSLALSLLTSFGVLQILSTPLSGLLRRLCPDDAAANFWLAYTRVMLTLAPMLLVVLISLFASPADLGNLVAYALLAILAGLLLGLDRIGRRLGRFVALPADQQTEGQA